MHQETVVNRDAGPGTRARDSSPDPEVLRSLSGIPVRRSPFEARIRSTNQAIILARIELEVAVMRFASVAELKDRLSEYLVRARKRGEAIVVTRHGKPYALTQPPEEEVVEDRKWKIISSMQMSHVTRCDIVCL